MRRLTSPYMVDRTRQFTPTHSSTIAAGRRLSITTHTSGNSGWQAKLGCELFPGAFGENLTTEGLVEDQVHIGDEFRIGTARLVVTQPRMPCYNLGIRFGNPGMVRSFLRARLPGIYFAVVEEGMVGPGDSVERVHRDERLITVSDMLALILNRNAAPGDLRRLVEIPGLAGVWREEFQSRLGN